MFPSILSILSWVVFVEIVRSICEKDGNKNAKHVMMASTRCHSGFGSSLKEGMT